MSDEQGSPASSESKEAVDKPFYKRPIWIVVGGFVLLGFLGLLADEDDDAEEATEQVDDEAVPTPTSTPIPTPTPTPEPVDQVDVPELAGMSVDEASEALADVGLEANPQIDDGTVDATDPSAGSTVEEGEEILLWVEPPRQEISGAGTDVTDPFTIRNDVIIWSFTHDGGSNFAVEAFDADGERLDALVNEIGRYDGQVVQEVVTSEVTLEITADGNWTAELQQPTFRVAEQLPVEVQGEGDGITPIFEGERGRSTLTYSHQGESNFAIQAYDDFDRVDVLVNEIGAVEGSVGATFDEEELGYILDITADGPWTIVIE